jgi:GNAT superfamily N-acetyltransferase
MSSENGQPPVEQQLLIRPATVADAALLVTLIDELNLHQGEPTGQVSEDAVRHDGFGPLPEFRVLLAELGGEVVGYALFHNTWSTEVGERGFYIYDLYVRDRARGRGIGQALIAAVARLARSEGRSFLWWSSKDWNRDAQAVYRKLGAIEEANRVHALFGEPFDELARDEEP